MKIIIFFLAILTINTNLIKIDIFDNLNSNELQDDVFKVYLGNNKNIVDSKELKIYLDKLSIFKFDISGFDINNCKSDIITCCNLFDKDNNLTTKYNSFKNFCISGTKIAFISLTDYEDENNILKRSETCLIKCINLVNMNFNPDIIIVLCNSPSNEILEIIKKVENSILISKFDKNFKQHKRFINQNLDNFKTLNIEVDKKIVLKYFFEEKLVKSEIKNHSIE